MRQIRRRKQNSGVEAGTVYTLSITRRRPGETATYGQSFTYTLQDPGDTVATALRELNSRTRLRDTEGNPADPIRWESSCLQKKCGACAMLVNGEPRLACDTPLRDLPKIIRLAPLRKFPVVTDLVIDRSIMQKNLREIRLWMEQSAEYREKTAEDAYEASRCLQCGLCLEVCPNFAAEGSFTGAAAAVPVTRVLTAQGARKQGELQKQYRKRVYEGCGKSLACRDICPAGIETGEMLAQSNAIAVWGRFRVKSHKRQ